MRVALIVLLAFQLLLGSLPQVSQASVQGIAKAVSVTAHADCGGEHAQKKEQPGGGTHGCCQVNACQCHCAQPPVALDLLPFITLPTSSASHPFVRTPPVTPRIDEFLRPPIA